MRTINHFVGGKEVAGNSGRFADVFNPATGEVQAKVALASKAEVDAAVKVAAEAFPKWSATPPLMRARVMFRFKQLIEENMDKMAQIVTSEHGKVISDAKGSITRGSSPASRRSISPPWCRCGCSPSRSPAATPSS
jgi:malonate-semialdehyde dehydrogenase (acetylating)/methylmalonate-semialdehyde dehydrogenase